MNCPAWKAQWEVTTTLCGPPMWTFFYLPAEAFLLKTPAPSPVGKGAESKIFFLKPQVLAEIVKKFSQ